MPETTSSISPQHLSPDQADAIRSHLSQVIESPIFAGSERCKDFLKLIVANALTEKWDHLRERVIGAELFGRRIDYDTANDAIVRVQATEVRRRLSRYYSANTDGQDLRIVLPSGSYVPRFEWPSADPQDAGLPTSFSIPSLPVTYRGIGEPPEVAHPSRSWRLSEKTIALTALILSVAAVCALVVPWRPSSHDPSRKIRSIAILSLADISSNPGHDYLADGMTEELIADLGQVSSLTVASKASSITYKGTKKTLPVIARELGVEAVVTGSVEREGDLVRITAHLIDAKTDRYIWSHSYVRNLNSVLSMQAEVAQAIADAVNAKVTSKEQIRFTRIRRVDPVAQEQYLIATHLLTISDPLTALSFLKRAVSIDPGNAQAHAVLANTYGWIGDAGWMPYSTAFNLEKVEAEKAVQLDEDLPDGHAALANAAMNLNWDWPTQYSELQKARDLNPSLTSVRWPYANYLERMGKFDDASVEARLAIRLDPVSSRAYTSAAFIEYFAGHYDEALGLLQKSDIFPHKSDELIFPSAVIHVEQHRYKEAIAEFEQLGNATHAIGHLGNAYARMGETSKAEEIIKQLQRQVVESNIGRYEIALIYTGLGRRQEAFVALEKGLAARDKGLTFLKIDPCLNPLRSDIRFEQLEQKVGLKRLD